MKTKRTMKSIAAAALALSLVAVPAAQNAVLNGGFSFGIFANAAAEPTLVDNLDGLKTAFANAQDGDVIKLTNNIDATELLEFTTGNVTLDLNNFELKDNNNDRGAIKVSGGTLTVTDSSVAGGGKITAKDGTDYSESKRYSMQIYGGKLIIEKGNITGHVAAFGNSTLEIQGGTITGKTFTDGYGFSDYAISTNGSKSKETTVIVSGGEVIGGDAGVYAPAGTVKISGGTISGNSGVLIRGGSIEVTGGTVIGNGEYVNATPTYDSQTGDGGVGNGDAIAIVTSSSAYGTAAVEIKGGNIESLNAHAVGTYVDGTKVTDVTKAVTGVVAGGVFKSGDGKDDFVTANTTEGASVLKNADTVAEITVTTNGVTKTVIGEETIEQVLEDSNITAVEVKQGLTEIDVRPDVTVTNSTGEDIVVNGVVVAEGEEAEALEPDKFSEVAEVPATCTATGTKLYYTYEGDDVSKYTKNEDEKYVLVADENELELPIDNTAHDYTDMTPVFDSWAVGDTSCTATVACARDCGHKETITGTIESVQTKAPSATETGVMTHTAKVTYNDIEYTDEKTSEIPISEEKKIEAIKTAVATALNGITVTNDTTEADIKAVVDKAVADTGVTGIDVTTAFTITTPATEEAAGAAKAVVTVKDEEVKHDYDIAKLTASTDPGKEPEDPGKEPEDPGKEPVTPAEKTDEEKAAEAKSTLESSWLPGADCSSWLNEKDIADWNAEETIANMAKEILKDTGAEVTPAGFSSADSDGYVTFTLKIKVGDAETTSKVKIKVAVSSSAAPVVNYYTVSFAGDYAGSGITVSSFSNAAGSTVTVKVPVGYSVSVVSGSNRIASISDGTGTFTMPSGNVTLNVTSYLGALTSGYKNAYIYSYDSEMNSITTNSVRGGMTAPEGEVTVKLGSKYAGRSVTLYNGRKSTSSKVDEAVLDSKGQATFSVKSGKNYTLVVE